VITTVAGRARRGRRFLFSALLVALLGVPAIARAQVDVHLEQIRYRDLVGTWSCTGTDRAGGAIATTLQWGFNDGASAGGDFYFLDQPRHPSATLPVISETWFFDTAAGADVWRTSPDPGSTDPVSWMSPGMSAKGGLMAFVRQAAPYGSRLFRLESPGRLSFREFTASRPDFALRCVRTVNNAPR
jgi:hypothetical protein